MFSGISDKDRANIRYYHPKFKIPKFMTHDNTANDEPMEVVDTSNEQDKKYPNYIEPPKKRKNAGNSKYFRVQPFMGRRPKNRNEF